MPRVLILVLFFVSSGGSSVQRATIVGSLIDDKGVAFPDATVCSYPLGVALGSKIPCVQSGPDGKFEFNQLSWGRYRVYAKKEEEGYPDKSLNLFGTEGTRDVDLSPQHPLQTILLNIGPKAGIIVAKVTDAISGDVAYDFSIKISLVADPKRWISAALLPEFHLLVPSNADLVFQCDAAGHKLWDYRNAHSPKGYLRLKPGEELKVKIELQRNNP